MTAKHVAVIGAGIIGATSAYYLRRAGWEVTILEKDRFGEGASHGNCGLITPSHALPLAVPGAVRKLLPDLFKPNAPVYIRPTFDPELWRWLFRFARRCREDLMLEAAAARSALLESSFSLFAELLEEESIECEWEHRGCYFVFGREDTLRAYAKSDRWLASLGLPGERLSADELAAREPALVPGTFAGGWFYGVDAHLRPDMLMQGLASALSRRGTVIRENAAVTGLTVEAGRVRAVRTSSGDLECDHVVVAAGALAPLLAGALGGSIPIQPGKGYSITMPRPAVCPRIPMIFQDQKVALTPFRSGYRLGSTMEFAGYDDRINARRLEAIRSAARRYLREPLAEPVEEEWCGWRPMTFDGLPIIDRAPALANAHVAAGHNMLGMSMGPATGKLIAELVTGGTTHVDPRPYAFNRF